MLRNVCLCNVGLLMTLPPLSFVWLILNRGPISNITRVLGVVTCVTIGTIQARETKEILEMTTVGWQGRLLVLIL